MKRTTGALLAITAAFGLAFTPLTAQAAVPTYVSGNICGDGFKLYPWGATNQSTTTTATVICPVTAAYSSDSPVLSSVSIVAYDRSGAENITCSLTGFDLVGNIVWQSSVATQGGGPGAGLQSRTAFVNNNFVRSVVASCTLPKAVVSGGQTWMSHLVHFELA